MRTRHVGPELQPGGENSNQLRDGSEEMIVVLRGTPALRAPEGEPVLAEGDVVVFPREPRAAKEIRDDSDAPARLLIVSTNSDPDVTDYPDSGKVGLIVGGELRVHKAENAVEHAGPG